MELKIADFGFSKRLTKNEKVYKRVAGTESYMAPELYKAKNSDMVFYTADLKRCDIFSLGIIFFIMVVGHPPFNLPNF